jgi:PKD domain
MKPSANYSVRIDEKVILLMLIVSILALFVSAFRFKNATPCNAFQFDVYANYFNVGHYIFCKATDTHNAEKWEWDFGDKTTPDKTSGPITSHVFGQPGQYIITLTINGRCKQYKNVTINSVRKDSIRYVTPQVAWPADPVMVGQNIVFRDITNGASRWEWYIGEGKESKRFVTQEVSFTFTSPGLVPVKLFVNNNIDAVQERIIKVEKAPIPRTFLPNYNRPSKLPRRFNIKDRPDNESLFLQKSDALPAESRPAAAPLLTKEYFLQMIKGVIAGTVKENDFEPYLCGNRNVRVSFNGDDIGFSECIERLRNLKKIKSLKAYAYTDSGSNCIINISIVYKRKTFLGL